MKAKLSRHFDTASYAVLLAAVIVAVVLLVKFNSANVNLRQALERAQAENPFRVGDYVPDVPAVSIGAELRDTTVLTAAPLPSVVYVWTPDCKFCVAERDKLGAFAQLARDRGYSFVALSAGELDETRRMFPHALSFPVPADPHRMMIRNYRVYATPAFLTVSRFRRIDRIHLGYLSLDEFTTKVFP